jgi:hypothetical protein
MYVYCYFYVFLLLCLGIFIVVYVLYMRFIVFSVLFVCKCVLYSCHRPSSQFQLTNISYNIIYSTL